MNSANNEGLTDLDRLQRSLPAVASWQNAQQLARNGRHAQAVASYRNLVHQFASVALLWAELGMAEAADLNFDAADEAFQRAAELASTDANFLVSIGTQYYQIRRLDRALSYLQRAVAVDPTSAHARLTLASWFERTRHLDEAWECVEVCLAQEPGNSRALHFKAFLLYGKGRHTEAEQALRDLLKHDALLPVDIQAEANHLLALVLDAVGQYDEAWSFLEKFKTLRRQSPARPALEQAYHTINQTRRKVLAEMKPATLHRWRDEASASPTPHSLALIGGAPRSGTTLLEQVLAAHSGVLVFDEPHSFVKELLDVFPPQHPARKMTFAALDGFDARGRIQLISRYFKSLLRETQENPGDRLALEKNPSTTAWLHIWLRFFPLSKIIIALRDPRDVIVSCYFQNIPLAWGNVSFLGLEQTMAFYSDCMDTWLRLREWGGFEWLETHYEDIVGNLEGEGPRVTNFLGLPWNEAQATFYEKSRRTFVHSPTYNEVTKPVHKGKVGRWEHYAGKLAPLQPALEPYLRAFGYA